ncbi:hypothetical protein KSP40_PGU014792 [Platanthera guangdongensis]|uniref:Protein S-acyltransferase n=1 Tax=Platanthera guangdongensis TaxID=2320717 RepID=A0ABR2M692_9ASPA
MGGAGVEISRAIAGMSAKTSSMLSKLTFMEVKFDASRGAIIYGVLLFPLALAVSLLLGWHIHLIAKNKTTIEHYEGVRAMWLAKKAGSAYQHPYDLGTYENLILLPNLLPFGLSSCVDVTANPVYALIMFILCFAFHDFLKWYLDLICFAGFAPRRAILVLVFGFQHLMKASLNTYQDNGNIARQNLNFRLLYFQTNKTFEPNCCSRSCIVAQKAGEYD